MIDNRKGGLLLILIGVGAYLYSTQSQASYGADSQGFAPNDPNPFPPDDYGGYIPEDFTTPEDEMLGTTKEALATNWKINEYPKYASFLRDTEDRNGIPRDLLARQLAKETGNYQLAIINGDKTSPVGAMGIAQFMPDTGTQYGLLPGKGPGTRTDPIASIAAAGRYMRDLFKMFNNWRYALAAYNWGPGNVRHWIRGDLRADGTPWQPPAETRDYLASITADVPVA